MNRVRPIQLPVTHKSVPPPWISVSVAPSAIQSVFGSNEADARAEIEARRNEQQQAALEMEKRIAAAVAKAEAETRARVEAEVSGQYDTAIKRLDLIGAELTDIRQRLLFSAEREMIDLALVIAQAILDRELKADRDYLIRLAKNAVAMVADGDEIEISVAPNDYPILAERLDEINRDNPRAGTLLLKANDAIEAGCIIETRLARVDATVATRLRTIAESLQAGEE